MIATLVFVNVITEFTAEFEKITEYNHINSRKEEGNVRFDVLHDNNDPNKYVLYEVYRDKEAAAAHKETEHYKKWKETVAPMLATPRSSIPTTPLCFD